MITNNTGCLITIRIAGGSSAFGESLLFSENLQEIYRYPNKLKGEKDDADENTWH